MEKKLSPLSILGIDKPFIGLRSYDSNENLLFFGRNKQIGELLQRLRQSRFLGVVGSSGCGKSSLIKAGLIPKLKGGFLTQERDTWRIGEMRPGNDPLYFLCETLINTTIKEDASETEISNKALALKNEILKKGVQAVIEELQKGIGTNLLNDDNFEEPNFLLLVDQFEEIFRFNEINSTANHESTDNIERLQDQCILFVNVLLALAEQTFFPVYVVITMRSDFIGNCNKFYGLPEMLNNGQYLVPRLDRQQRKEVIEGPIRLFNASLNNSLLNRLLNDSDVGMDELPVLQHALMRTWNYWLNHRTLQEPLDLADYTAIGGIENSINQHANEIFDALNTKQQKIAEVVFKGLTAFNSEDKAIRRPLKLKELIAICQSLNASPEDVKSVIEHFSERECAFLMPPKDKITEETVIDISHESLMRQWDKLIVWMKQEQESARNFKWLSETLELQEETNKSLFTNKKMGWWFRIIKSKRQYLRGLDLKRALAWKKFQNPNAAWAVRYSDNLKEVLHFIQISIKKRRIRRIANVFIYLIVFLFITILISAMILSVHEKKDAEENAKLEMKKDAETQMLLQLYNKISDNNRKIDSARTDTLTKITLLKENILLRDSIHAHSAEDSAWNKDFSFDCGNLSYYLIVTKQYDSAKYYANKGLNLYPENDWIKTNLALAYLLGNNFEEAMKIYKENKDKTEISTGEAFKDAFLKDFEDLQKAHAITGDEPEVQKAKEFLTSP